ncbi:penicillin-binding protein 2 [Thauera mechernichensis]|uniref:Peptidoglycan D,D-transpeptidase MrdA n=1 Tax=Thauera mechernichensis TaxID=82788 RepID=A0ABW3WC62_9RHOO|nr:MULTISPECIES: penicillin-binding protein 2 [Thauera]ENO81958.1 penicillin-binding protein 2 [Thauera sp. 27]ENO94190.1 penicillin-binding protein 2 [Thauera sp. 28]MDG3066721.1 penicillin-binding protein 2 [Thauera mechernichensis]WBL64479.1 penicillin-binding protein 2 [Thauera sp. WB-2]HNR61807.1 penicillin-binding protein 2 [Thauera sp.]
MTEFRTPAADLARFRLRVVVAAVFVLICLGLLAARFHFLQVQRHDYFLTRAEDNRIALLPVVPHRGTIVDRNGVVLARNYATYTLEIMPSEVRDLEGTLAELSTLVPIEPRDLRRFRKLFEESRNFESVPVRSRLTDEEVARVVSQRYRLPGVDVRARLLRDYPQGTTAAHVVGYIGRINERDVERIEERGQTANYRGTLHIGKAGLEQSYEAELHGTTGVEQVEVNASGRAVRALSHTPASSGNDLELTLDIELQRVAETAFGDRRGALVAIEPSTGGVLALVSMPTYDPNLFVDGISTQDWRALNESPDHPLLHRAIYSTYPPGSTFKPFMALAGLETGKRTARQAIHDVGYFNFGGHRFMDDKIGGHGMVDLHKSIVVSCNTYYYQLANELGIEGIASFMAPFGFGDRTGIDLPGEAIGVLPSPEWKRNRFRKPEQQRWYAGETISVGIGQGYNAFTPLQLANAMAALVNDGKLFRPHVVKYVVDSRTGERRAIEPEPLREIPLKQAHLKAVLDAMVDVNKSGTGRRAFQGAPYSVGGKTGTAQVFSLRGQRYVEKNVRERLRDHSWFVAYAPAENPKIALAVLVENGGFGSQSAAPIARQVIDYYLLDQRAGAPAAEDDNATESEDAANGTAPARTGEGDPPPREPAAPAVPQAALVPGQPTRVTR